MSDQKVFLLPPFERRQWAPEPPASLAHAPGESYLHTPTANQNASFPHTPYIQGPQTPGFHSPASFNTPAFSNVQLTPALAGAYAPHGLEQFEGREIRYSPGEFDMSGGLNIAFDGFNEPGSVETIPEEDLPRMPEFQDPYSGHRLPPRSKPAGGPNPHPPAGYAPPKYVKQENNLPLFSPISHQGFPLHHASPFTQKELQSSNEPITIEDLLKDEPFSTLERPSVSCIDDDDLLSLFFDFDDETPTKKTPPSSRHRVSKSTTTPTKPPRHKIPTFSAVASDNSTSKHVRKCKSFSNSQKFSSTSAGPAFSLEECFNEFHVTEGNYSFQDETARLSMQLGPGMAPKKNNSAEQSRPMLKKSKTTSNLCLPRLECRNPKVLNNMELGLVLFQVNLKNSK